MQNAVKNGRMKQIDREKLVEKFVYELPILRVRIDMTRDD